jgi:hypothetical protein
LVDDDGSDDNNLINGADNNADNTNNTNNTNDANDANDANNTVEAKDTDANDTDDNKANKLMSSNCTFSFLWCGARQCGTKSNAVNLILRLFLYNF